MAYTNDQKRYLQTRPANVVEYETIHFSHPDFGDIYLVANQYTQKTLNIGGQAVPFTPVSMEIPKVANGQATIKFARIGQQFRSKLRMITLENSFVPITATIRLYKSNAVQPTFESSLFVSNNGISLSEDAVTVRLSADNPAKISQSKYFYDPSVFVGLING